jgi:hypothetical protein
MEHLSSDVEQHQEQQNKVQWRKYKVQELYSKAYSQKTEYYFGAQKHLK